MTADSVTVNHDRGVVVGTYRQRVRLPNASVVEVHGAYRAQWERGAGRRWLIRSLSTSSG